MVVCPHPPRSEWNSSPPAPPPRGVGGGGWDPSSCFGRAPGGGMLDPLCRSTWPWTRAARDVGPLSRAGPAIPRRCEAQPQASQERTRAYNGVPHDGHRTTAPSPREGGRRMYWAIGKCSENPLTPAATATQPPPLAWLWCTPGGGGLQRSGVDPPLSSSGAGLHTAFIATSVHCVFDWPFDCPLAHSSQTHPSLSGARFMTCWFWACSPAVVVGGFGTKPRYGGWGGVASLQQLQKSRGSLV